MDEENDTEDNPVLSSTALDALSEFYADRDAHQKQFEGLKIGAALSLEEPPPLSMEAFAENWNESQFWYSTETATILANELLDGASEGTTIAVISAPSVFVQLKNIISSRHVPNAEKPTIYLLEFDKRFGVFPEFIFYDFHNPLDLPPTLRSSIDRIICDPPFLSEDCQTKAALTIRWLSRSWGITPSTRGISGIPSRAQSPSRLIICTGERMETLVNRLYWPQRVETTTFEPAHAKGLSNEFFCYANFECEKWGWRKVTAVYEQ